ncbi:hypothetical protein Patl1_13055 [Pistacia atlantica]|uniref:Uncharacterized protein n=1 Tax=Pistacia atlantica TaxID=434234 RepID=A0ACC1ATD7_9ROSI|nr:hypothetical protein Patl1_13055 [Pistacia atlantica]
MIHMELQLGLALPSTAVKGFDLNAYVYEPRENMGSHPSFHSFGFTNDICSNYKKRNFDEAFEKDKTVPRTLPLLHWNNEPNDEDDPKDLENNSSFDSNKTAEEDVVVGWPPIKTWRKKIWHQDQGRQAKPKNNQAVKNIGFGSRSAQSKSNSMYVKVKMEGMAIARKIDLSLHDSFETLTTTLISMFCVWHDDSNNYKLTYQDKEGDWLIAQDVPWRTFIRTVQRLKLLKISE